MTNDSLLPVTDSIDCRANDELIELSGLGGGGVGDFRRDGDAGRDVGRDVDGRSPGFGETGRTYGSGLCSGSDFTADVEAGGP